MQHHSAPGSEHSRQPHSRGQSAPPAGSGGIPDGLLLGILALLLGITVLTWTATGLAGLLAHGAWPDGVAFVQTPMAIRDLAADPQDLPAAWPGVEPAQLPGYGLFWGVFISQLMVAAVLVVFTVGTVSRARAVRARRRAAASHGAVQHSTDTSSAPTEASPSARPATRHPEAEPTQPYNPEPQHGTAPAAPPSFTKTGQRTPAPRPSGSEPAATDPHTRVLDAPGAALVATSDPELWSATKDARSRIGPVHLFDPGQLCDTPDRIRWSPHHGCAGKQTATTRAAALLAPLRSPRPIDAEVHSAAETLLRCWLHAAALDDRPFREVHRWASAKSVANDPVQILRTHPKASAGAAGELEATLTGHPERRREATDLVRKALAPLSSLHVRNACTASRADRIALESFADETGTLYVVGDDEELMPLLNALTQSVVELGRRMAARSSPGRLDPPLTTVLELPLYDSEMPSQQGRPQPLS